MTSAQVVETSVTNNSSFQNYTHPEDHTIRTIKPYLQNEQGDSPPPPPILGAYLAKMDVYLITGC